MKGTVFSKIHTENRAHRLMRDWKRCRSCQLHGALAAIKTKNSFNALVTATAAVDVCGPRGGGLTRPRHALEAHLGREVVLIIGSNRVKIAPWVPPPRPVAHAYEAQCQFLWTRRISASSIQNESSRHSKLSF